MFGQDQCSDPRAAGSPPTLLQRETRQGYILLCLALWSTIMFLLIHRFVITSVVVQGQSMSPTLKAGERYYVNRWLPYLVDYQRGNVVVIRDRERDELMVKRIIGLPGDAIQLLKGRVYVNGRVLDEPYVAPKGYTYSRLLGLRKVVVAKDSFYVLGDNRLNSEDSRIYGDVDRADVLGVIRF